MIPAIRDCVLQYDGLGLANTESGFGKHSSTLYELRRMFAYLLESERKAYNPFLRFFGGLQATSPSERPRSDPPVEGVGSRSGPPSAINLEDTSLPKKKSGMALGEYWFGAALVLLWYCFGTG